MSIDKNSKIFVAGHKGLVGSAILDLLKFNGYQNIISRSHQELDLTNQQKTFEFFESESPEYVFLAAAKVGGIIANRDYPADFIYENLMIATNVIFNSFKFGVKKLLNLGSSCIYPKLAPQPLKEEFLLTSELEPSNEGYAIAKIAAIKMCSAFNKQYGTEFISLMPSNLYGSNDNFNLETSHVLPALIRKSILAKFLQNNNFDFIKKDLKFHKIGFGLDDKIDLTNEISIIQILNDLGITEKYLTIWGSGNARREFLHINDLAEACIFFMNNHSYREIDDFVNIGTGEDISIKELLDIITNKLGLDIEVRYDKTKPDGTPKKVMDITKSKNLGWTPKISLEDGVSIIIKDYMKKVEQL